MNLSIVTKSILITILLHTVVSFQASDREPSHTAPEPNIDGIHMLSFNAWALPVWLPKTDQINRYKRIPAELIAQDADILCIQEAFAKKFRKRLMPALSEHYYSASDYYCNSSIVGPVVKDCHGGLVTFSKYPILEETFYPYPIYSEMRIEERIGEKGFLLTTVDGPEGTMHIVNTHLYAGLEEADERHRMIQIQHMDSILQSIPQLSYESVFLLGDLNVRHPEVSKATDKPISTVYSFITETMGFTDPVQHMQDDYYTVDISANHYCGTNNGRQKLDYCMHRMPTSTTLSCTTQQTVLKGAHSVSDHIGWRATFELSSVRSEDLAGPSAPSAPDAEISDIGVE